MLIFLQFSIGTRAVVTSSRHRHYSHLPVMESRTQASRPRPRPRPRTSKLSSRILEDEDLSSRTPTLSLALSLFIRNMQRATRISVCVIAVSKSHEFLLKVRRLSFFSTTTPTPSRRRVVSFPRRRKGLDFRRRVDVFPRRRTLQPSH